jgi:hypothetical protein
MRRVRIIDEPDKTYPYAAIDRQTGEIPLRHHDRTELMVLCLRLEWKIEEAEQDVRAGRQTRPAGRTISEPLCQTPRVLTNKQARGLHASFCTNQLTQPQALVGSGKSPGLSLSISIRLVPGDGRTALLIGRMISIRWGPRSARRQSVEFGGNSRAQGRAAGGMMVGHLSAESYAPSSLSSALASFRSSVSNPSVNQP